jgi:hypothetical protein
MLDRGEFAAMRRNIPTDCQMQFAGWCEPFVNPAAARMMVECAMEGRPLSLYTTLVGATARKIVEIARLPFITFTVHLPDAEGNSVIRVGTDYRDALACVLLLKPANLRIVAHGPTVHESVRDMVPRCENQGIHSVAGHSDVLRAPERQGPVFCEPAGPGCYDHNVMLPNGDVYSCCQDWGMEYKVGNLLEQRYETLAQRQTLLCRRCDMSVDAGRVAAGLTKYPDALKVVQSCLT